jgi:hypothetical protein
LCDIGRISDSLITPDVLRSAGIRGVQNGLYFRGEESSGFRLKEIVVFGTKFDTAAINKVESLGGHAVSVYLTENGWNKLGNQCKFHRSRNFINVPPDDWRELNFYSDYSARGYLNEEVRANLPLKARNYIQDNFILLDKVDYQRIPC